MDKIYALALAEITEHLALAEITEHYALAAAMVEVEKMLKEIQMTKIISQPPWKMKIKQNWSVNDKKKIFESTTC